LFGPQGILVCSTSDSKDSRTLIVATAAMLHLAFNAMYVHVADHSRTPQSSTFPAMCNYFRLARRPRPPRSPSVPWIHSMSILLHIRHLNNPKLGNSTYITSGFSRQLPSGLTKQYRGICGTLIILPPRLCHNSTRPLPRV
jgi:hypothetical protein